MVKLIIEDDEGKTTVVPLIRDEITIGRKEGNTIRLTERNADYSFRHQKRTNIYKEIQHFISLYFQLEVHSQVDLSTRYLCNCYYHLN